jgi:hypothetical protein
MVGFEGIEWGRGEKSKRCMSGSTLSFGQGHFGLFANNRTSLRRDFTVGGDGSINLGMNVSFGVK